MDPSAGNLSVVHTKCNTQVKQTEELLDLIKDDVMREGEQWKE
jgi:hypothetical protein